MTTLDEARFNRLPRWAQAKINSLQNRHEDAARQRDTLAAILSREATDQSVIVEPDGEGEIFLPAGTTIRFHLDGSGHRYVDVSTVDGGEMRTLHVAGSGSSLTVRPVSANYIAIAANKR